MNVTDSSDSGRLARRLTLADAVIIGLGAMIGAGIFAAPGPAAAAAGWWLLAGLVIAGVTAYLNATSSAQLAAKYPEAGGTYVYARYRLGSFPGFLAGWAFVIGKTASLAAMALTFGAYIDEDWSRPLGVAAVIVMTIVNYLGVTKTARVTRLIVFLVLGVLALTVAAFVATSAQGVSGPTADLPRGVWGVLQASGLLFFAFAGYARIATLGEEVREPERNIRIAIPRALGLTLAVYAVVLFSALLAVGPSLLAASPAPLAAAVASGPWAAMTPLVRAGAALAAAGVLLSLLAGVSRTELAMARRRELPAYLDAVHPRHRTPYRAEIATAVVVIGIVCVADLRGAIGFSSFAVLLYYALANASAWTLPRGDRTHPRWLSGLGLVLCLVLCVTLPITSIAVGVLMLAVGAGSWFVVSRRSRPT